MLDAEVVAVDRAAAGGAVGSETVLKSFQELSTRARGAVSAEQVTSTSSAAAYAVAGLTYASALHQLCTTVCAACVMPCTP